VTAVPEPKLDRLASLIRCRPQRRTATGVPSPRALPGWRPELRNQGSPLRPSRPRWRSTRCSDGPKAHSCCENPADWLRAPQRQCAQAIQHTSKQPRIRACGALPACPAERKQSAVSTQPTTRFREVLAGVTGPGQQRWPGAVTEAGSDPHWAHRPGRVAQDPAAGAAGGGDGGDIVGPWYW
jgi:hypothetical protein